MCCCLLEKRHCRWFGHSSKGFLPAFVSSFITFLVPVLGTALPLLLIKHLINWTVNHLVDPDFLLSAPTIFFCLSNPDLSPVLPFWNARFWQQCSPITVLPLTSPRILPFLWSPCLIWRHWVTVFCKACLEKQPNLTVYPVLGSENLFRLHPLHLADRD